MFEVENTRTLFLLRFGSNWFLEKIELIIRSIGMYGVLGCTDYWDVRSIGMYGVLG